MDIHQVIPRSWQQYTIMHLNRRMASRPGLGCLV